MRTPVLWAALLLAASAGTALAQTDEKAPRIVVQGTATIETPPTLATVNYSIVGEGATPDAATSAFLSKRKAIESELQAFGIDPTTIHTGKLSVVEARSGDCEQDSYRGASQLSTGVCAIKGYITQATFTLTMSPPEKAGTVVASVGRLGGGGAKVEEFSISNEDEVHRQATVKALANARSFAETIASASGAHLGALIDVRDTNQGGGVVEDVVVTGSRIRAYAPPKVLNVELRPETIKITAHLFVTYAIAP